MTDQLATLLRAEVDHLDVPAPPTGAVLTRGRILRRRRTHIRTAAVTCLAVVCVIGGLGLLRSPGSERRLDGDIQVSDAARAQTAYVTQGAYAVGADLVVGANRFEWSEPIKALHYTSAGVVIQSGTNADRDTGGSNYALITPTGEWSDVDVALDDQLAGFDVGSTLMAYAEPAGTGYDLVVHDVAADREVSRVSVDIGEGYGGWRAPPVAIDGDLVWVHGAEGWTQWNWSTGEVRSIPGTGSTYEVAGGVYADWQDQDRWLVRSMTDSSLVRELDLRPGWYGFFSPDGRYMRSFPNMTAGDGPVDFEFFSVGTGATWQLSDVMETHARVELGWTPEGGVLQLLDGTLSLCQPETGVCEEQQTGLGESKVRLGGEPYSS